MLGAYSRDGLARSMETLKRKLDSLASRSSEILPLRKQLAPRELMMSYHWMLLAGRIGGKTDDTIVRKTMADSWMRLAGRIQGEIDDILSRSSSGGLLSRVILVRKAIELTERVDQLLDISTPPERLSVVRFQDLGGFGRELADSISWMRSGLKAAIFIASCMTNRLKFKRWKLKRTKMQVIFWLEQLEKTRQAVYDIELDVAIGTKMGSGNLSWSWLRALAHRIDYQTTELDWLIRHHSRFLEATLDVPDEKCEQHVRKPVGESFRRNFIKIWDCLTNNQCQGIGIYGPAGVGKTILAMHIHNELLRHNFNDVLWMKSVEESEECIGIHELQRQLAHAFGLDLSETEDQVVRAERLSNFLSTKDAVIIILDDVRECYDLDKVGIPLSRCKVIVTSRSLDICRGMQCEEAIGVDPLPEEESWDFFKQFMRCLEFTNPKMEGMAKSVAKTCGGLPSRLIHIASRMRGYGEDKILNLYKWEYMQLQLNTGDI